MISRGIFVFLIILTTTTADLTNTTADPTIPTTDSTEIQTEANTTLPPGNFCRYVALTEEEASNLADTKEMSCELNCGQESCDEFDVGFDFLFDQDCKFNMSFNGYENSFINCPLEPHKLGDGAYCEADMLPAFGGHGFFPKQNFSESIWPVGTHNIDNYGDFDVYQVVCGTYDCDENPSCWKGDFTCQSCCETYESTHGQYCWNDEYTPGGCCVPAEDNGTSGDEVWKYQKEARIFGLCVAGALALLALHVLLCYGRKYRMDDDEQDHFNDTPPPLNTTQRTNTDLTQYTRYKTYSEHPENFTSQANINSPIDPESEKTKV